MKLKGALCHHEFIGDLSGAVNIVVPFNLTGQAEVQAEGLSVQLDSAIERAANGSAHISSIACHSTIRAVDVTNHNGGLFGLAVTVFKVLIRRVASHSVANRSWGQGVSEQTFGDSLQGLICKKIRKYLDEDLNEKSISKEFYIDFRLREDPFCGTNMVDLACAGEISYKGLGGTPFGPPPIAWIRSQSDTHMLMLQISDYLPNSLFYHAHKYVRFFPLSHFVYSGSKLALELRIRRRVWNIFAASLRE
ncbi:hypothetical protein COOONC_23961 [Cooperia oncophora]